MDVVVVPLVWQEAEVGPLLELLDRRERSGVVVHHYLSDGSERYRLVYAGPLLEARRAEVPTVGEVPGGHDVLVVDDGIAQSFDLDLVRPGRTWERYETCWCCSTTPRTSGRNASWPWPTGYGPASAPERSPPRPSATWAGACRAMPSAATAST